MNTADHQRSRHNLLTLMVGCFVCLLAFTLRASLERHVFDNAALVKDAWFQVTLLDAYLGFLIFYVWVVSKERSVLSRVIWFVLIICFGNMATSLYVIVQVIRHPNYRSVSDILVRQCPGSDSASSAERC